ncbi:hypothetical protein MMC08_000980 [Hypocenomyce scalaris]|nr:hypothetical protein [Hypocenomyce scalaris]
MSLRYDPKYGYNRNAFAHKTLPPAIISKTVKVTVAPIGLVSEANHHHKDKKRSQSNSDVLEAATTAEAGSENATSPSEGQGDEPAAAYVTLPVDQADELIATSQAIPAEGETATHELVLEKDDGIARDEADWALDEAASETEEQKEPDSSHEGGKEEPVAELVTTAQASPIFDIVMIATGVMGLYPDVMVGAAVQALQIAAKIGQEAQERWRTNKVPRSGQ